MGIVVRWIWLIVYVENGMAYQWLAGYGKLKVRLNMDGEKDLRPRFYFLIFTPNFLEKSFNYIKNIGKRKDPSFCIWRTIYHTPAILPTEEWQGKSI